MSGKVICHGICLAALILAFSGAFAQNQGETESTSEEPESRSVLRRGDGLSPKVSIHGFSDATFIAEDVSLPDDEE